MIRAILHADVLRQAALRLLLPYKWSGFVMIRGDVSLSHIASAAFKSPANSSRGVLGDLGNLLGWRDPWGVGEEGSNEGGGGEIGRGLGSSNSEWREVFLVLQGHRIVWWSSEYDIDEGKACQGQLLLYGHAGTTQASPILIRELNALGMYESRLVCVFGRDVTGLPQRCTLLCPDATSKDSLSLEIMNVLTV